MNGCQARDFQRVLHWYHYADVMIASAWPLGDLPIAEPATSDEPAVYIRLTETAPREPDKADWVHNWLTVRGGLFLALARTTDGFLLRFPDLVDFTISTDRRQITAWPAAVTGIETLRHLLLDHVLPRVLAEHGRLILHAGAVRLGDKAIAFVGDTGSGKSTLTASLDAAGYSLLSDDSLVLTRGNKFTPALATYPSLRLWPDAVSGLYPQPPALASVAHYTTKQRVMMPDVAAAKDLLALAALYVLTPETETVAPSISVTRLKPREACMAIIGNSFRLDLTDRHHVAEVFADACRIAEHLPAFSLAYPREFARLPEVHEAILNSLENEPIGGTSNLAQ